MWNRRTALGLSFVFWCAPRAVSAESCAGPLDRNAVVACALAQSLEVRSARQALVGLDGRMLTASTLLPSNPVAAVSVADRRAPDGQHFLNWYVTLSQAISIAGQRGARRSVVDAERAAQTRRVAVAELDTAAAALRAYYQVLTARTAFTLGTEIATTARTLNDFADVRAREALLSPLDANLIRAESVRLGSLAAGAERRVRTAEATLATLLGQLSSARIELTADTTPLPTPALSEPALVDHARLLRGEVAAAEMEQKVRKAELSLLRRSRVPDVTLSFIAQRDGMNELVLGAGLSVPIPLPAPLGHTNAGAIAEQHAYIAAAQLDVETVRRRVTLEVESAIAAERAAERQRALYGEGLVQSARQQLAALREGLTSRQLSVRDALFAQRALVELLIGNVDAALALAVARVDLYRLVGLPLEVQK